MRASRLKGKRLEKEIDEQRVKGMAMRRHALEGMAAVRDMVTFPNAFLEALDAVPGRPDDQGPQERQVLPDARGRRHADIDMTTCSAYQGEVLVSGKGRGRQPEEHQGRRGTA